MCSMHTAGFEKQFQRRALKDKEKLCIKGSQVKYMSWFLHENFGVKSNTNINLNFFENHKTGCIRRLLLQSK